MENKRFVITVTIQSNSPGSTPVDATWYRGENHAEALAALVQAAAKDIGGESMPEVMRTKVKAVRMDIYDLPVEREADPWCHEHNTHRPCPGCPSDDDWETRVVSGNTGASTSTVQMTGFKSNSILREAEHGTYYTGPLEPAIEAMRREYGDDLVVEDHSNDGYYLVAEFRGSGPSNPNQWGVGETEEEAWRYLIGAEFGPLDDTYEDEGYEAHQRRMLGLNGATSSTEEG